MIIEPCKVCGGKGHVNYGTNGRHSSYSVICLKCNSEPFILWCDTPDKAIEAWNTPLSFYTKVPEDVPF